AVHLLRRRDRDDRCADPARAGRRRRRPRPRAHADAVGRVFQCGLTTGDPWPPMGHFARNTVAAQRDDPASLFSLYRRLNWLRKSSPALRRGSYRTVAAPRGVFAYAREAEGEQILVALNFTKSAQVVSLGSGAERIALSTDHT